MGKDRIDLPGFAAVTSADPSVGSQLFCNKGFQHRAFPVFTAFLRSAIASACGIVYCLVVRQPIFHRDIRLLHGLVVGLLFGVEFICIYLGMLYTNAARAAVLVYLAPFVVAAGAHFFLGERLNLMKTLSLAFAFFGVYLVFAGKPSVHAPSMLLGDILELVAAILWGVTTLYIKRYLSQRVHPINTFIYQLVFSIPIMAAVAYFLEPTWISGVVSTGVVVSLVYQSVIVAFASYLTWFKLIHAYPVASLSVFTFLAPIFGVASGVIFLGEDLTMGLVMGLICVCLGICGTNYRKREGERTALT